MDGDVLGRMESDLKGFISRHSNKYEQLDTRSKELQARLLGVEQAVVARNPGAPMGGFGGEKSLGATVVDSEQFRSFQKGASRSGRIEVGSFQKNILTGPWTVAPDYIPRMAVPAQPRLPLRALLPSYATQSNMIEFPREESHTGGADYQLVEGTDKVQTDFVYSLQQVPVATLAHWVAASRQVLDDSTALSSYINGRMLYLLEQKTETELLFGSGSAGHLKGLCTVATPATGAPSDFLTATANAISQLAAAGRQADFLVANPVDWWAARQLKAVGSGVYLIGDPMAATAPQVWGLAVSLSLSMPRGQFLIGVTNECAVADRQQAVLEISREHASFFTQNMIAILIEERLALVVYQPTAFVYGAVTVVGS
jgi:HK97 family phage major capsid protein